MSTWYLRLLGSLQAERDGQIITRFRSQKFAVLLAYLAVFPRRTHSREELADLLWPDAEVEVSRTNLRTAFSSLRRQLEPPGTPAGSVLITEGRHHVRVNGEGITTDTAAFEKAVTEAGRSSTSQEQRLKLWTDAVSLYGGPLLPGFYETWVLTERDRLAEAYQNTLNNLIEHYEQAGDTTTALSLARRAVTAEPLFENAHALVIRLLMASGQKAAAERQFSEMSRLLDEHLAMEPAPETRALLERDFAANPIPRPPATPRFRPAENQDLLLPLPGGEPLAGTPETLQETPVRLPVSVTRFFGRESEMATLQEMLSEEETRLATLTGPGGAGKTRLAIETARRTAGFFSGGVWFVSLAEIHEAEQVPSSIAEVLSLVRSPALLPTDQIISMLNRRDKGPLLLVLDNYEQLVDRGAGEVVQTLITAVPSLSVLVTSRQRLQIEGEREFPLPLLAVPFQPGTPDRLLEFASVQIFVDRARAARVDFQLSARNADAVAALCLKLEGIPLAIELAAAWAETLTPVQMLKLLENRQNSSPLLATRRRDVPGRHATLRATVEWSYDLLAPALQRFFRQLSVFHGGWVLEAAEAVLDEPLAFQYLGALRERSLVLTEETTSDEMRFRMLETLREFAEEHQQNDASQEEINRLRHRHAHWCLDFAEQAAPHLAAGDHQAEWLDKLQTEQDNLRAALDYFLRNDVEAELRLATALFRFWQVRGPITEAHKWLEQGLEQEGKSSGTPAKPLVRAQALERSGTLAWYRSDLGTAHARLEESLSLYRELGDARGIASALNSFVGMQNITGNPREARARLEAGIAELADIGGTAADEGRQILLESLTRAAVMGNDVAAAERFGGEWLALARQADDSHPISGAYLWLGYAAMNAGDHAHAHARLSEALKTAREISEALYTSSALWGLGYLALFRGEISEAGSLQREALRHIAGVTGYDFAVVYIIEALTLVAVADGDLTRSARLLGVAHSLRGQLGYHLAPVLREVNLEEAREKVRAALGERQFKQSFDAGFALPLELAVREALLPGRENTAPAAVSLEAPFSLR